MTGIGERINARRKELGMTQEELSKKLGYKNKSTISQIENGVNDIMQSKVASFAEALNTTVAYLVGLEEPTQPKKNASGMKYAKIREIRNQLERCRYVVMSAEAKIKRVEPLSQKFEQTVQLIQDTKEQVNNLVWQELRCKEELRAEEQQERKQDPQWVNEWQRTKNKQREPGRIPEQGGSHGEQRNTGTDASNRHDSKTFQSNEQSKLGSGQTLVPGGICWDACRQAARTRAIQRPYACYADAFGRPGGMEEDLYNG